ncbi:terminase gpA endonuclease subunit [Paucibacter sp. APW11]|uniref:Terminase gpA endonuclease subunit n=1 Tax=Roseateles aquae TaxID=3077235 RepID=A0ABU3P708_9BURK|nr:terminase gpA endonuclease subunit [Paucibacter sp. APW11]MDT8998358.1 terminase gpA endonuclease subunit [Paucibacter sp. APW11]
MNMALLPRQAWAVAAAEARAAIERAMRKGLSPLKAVPPQRLSTWAAKNFYLSAESSQGQQDWVAYPFQIGIMDAFSNDAIEEVNVPKSARVGYTKMLLAFMAYNAHHRRRNQAIWQPTDDDRDSFVKTELEPMLRDVECMASVFVGASVKSKENTLHLKRFLGSVLHTLGGKAAKNYRRITVAAALLDEIDGFDQRVEKSADPITLAGKRLEGAAYPKLIVGSTPRIKGMSHVERRANVAEAYMRYQVPCVHCGLDHPLTWGGKDVRHGFKWNAGDPDSAHHVCPHCHGSITQADYLRIWDQGSWVDDRGGFRYDHHTAQWLSLVSGMPVKPPRHVAFHVWTAYSPQTTWAKIARECIEAAASLKAGDDGAMQGFVNETRGETYELDFESTESSVLEQRAKAEPHPWPLRTVPQCAVHVVTGVDTQKDRWELVSWGVGRGEELWAVDYQVVYGNPADLREWDDKLKPALERQFQHHSGMPMHADAVAIDTGGNFTHQCYQFISRNAKAHPRWYAIKGESEYGKPIKSRSKLVDIKANGRIQKRGVRLWFVGTDTAKDLLHGRLSVTEPGEGCIHFTPALPSEFYAQLTAEKRIPVRTPKGMTTRWDCPVGKRNEVLDCTVYALFCIQMLEVHKYTEALWRRLSAALEPDLFSQVPEAPSSAPEADAEEAEPIAAAGGNARDRRRTLAPAAPGGLASTEWMSRL